MDQGFFISTIRTYTKFSDRETELFLSFFTERKFKRNERLLEEGMVAHEVFFISKGAVRQCFVTEEGLERTCNFSFEGDFITDLESFSRQSRSSSGIVALEPVECFSIRCLDVVAALNQSAAVAELFRIVVENVAADNIRRTKAMLSLSLEKQFEELMHQKPGLLQRVPQRYIAQYLGIAPESLSRIRKRVMETAKS